MAASFVVEQPAHIRVPASSSQYWDNFYTRGNICQEYIHPASMGKKATGIQEVNNTNLTLRETTIPASRPAAVKVNMYVWELGFWSSRITLGKSAAWAHRVE